MPSLTAALSEVYTETHVQRHTHRGEKREREGVRDTSTEIEQDWPRSEPACLATCLAYEFFKEVMSRYGQCGWHIEWLLLSSVCTTKEYRPRRLIPDRKISCIKLIIAVITVCQCSVSVTLPSTGDVFNRLQSPWTSPYVSSILLMASGPLSSIKARSSLSEQPNSPSWLASTKEFFTPLYELFAMSRRFHTLL